MNSRFAILMLLTVFAGMAGVRAEVTIRIDESSERVARLGGTRFIQTEKLMVESDRTLEGDAYVFSNRAAIRGAIEGDLSLFATDLDLGGTVSGDLNAFARYIDIDGVVDDDVRVAVESLKVEGTVTGDLLVLAASLYLRPPATVRGGVIVYAADISLEGDVKGPVRASGGAVRLAGNFGSDVWVECDELTLDPGVHIAGNLVYKAHNAIDPPAGAIGGEVQRIEISAQEVAEEKDSESPFSLSTAARTMLHVYLAFVALIGGVLLVLFFRPFVEGALGHAGGATPLVASFGIGLVCLLVALVLSLVCLVVLPLSLGLLSALGALIYFGSLLGKMIVGQILLRPLMRREIHPALALVAGVGVFFVIDFIPVAGELLWLFFTIAGMGAALHQLRCSGPVAQASSAVAE